MKAIGNRKERETSMCFYVRMCSVMKAEKWANCTDVSSQYRGKSKEEALPKRDSVLTVEQEVRHVFVYVSIQIVCFTCLLVGGSCVASLLMWLVRVLAAFAEMILLVMTDIQPFRHSVPNS